MRTTGCSCRAPLAGRRELSELAYGFMASKALFAALEVGLFTGLASGPCTAAELASATGIPANRLCTLLRALTALGLVIERDGSYLNAPACERYLVRGAPHDFGEYFRLQVSQQIYPALVHLEAGLAGTGGAFDTLAGLLADPAEAWTFTAAQHAGSLGAARMLAGRLDLDGATRLLDVGGGSGAFSIAFCDRHPGLRATILDFPAVLDVARGYLDAAGLAGRVDLLEGDAVARPWPGDQDVVLLSYLLSALGDAEIDVVLARAYDALRPGGLLVVHDFMLDDEGAGPVPAALWFLQYLAYRPDAVSFTAVELAGRLRRIGFVPEPGEPLIPDITAVVTARKEART